MTRPVVGIVGLGLVGQAIGLRLRSQGWSTLGFDVQAQACDRFSAGGGRVMPDLASLGREAATVILAVFDTNGVLEVLEGPDGLLQPGHTVGTLIDCSTGSPHLLQALAARLAAQGIALLEAPLSGSSQQIGAGEATALLGGEASVVRACEPLLGALAADRIHVGAAGSGAQAKLATNLVLGLNRAALAEGFAFAEAMGIPAERFLQLVLATPARSDAARVKGPLMAADDFAPRSRVRQHLKDVDLMLAQAEAAGLDLPFSTIHARLMREAVAAGEGDLDNAAIVRRLRRRPLQNRKTPDA